MGSDRWLWMASPLKARKRSGVLRRDGQVHMLVKDDVDLLLFDQDVGPAVGPCCGSPRRSAETTLISGRAPRWPVPAVRGFVRVHLEERIWAGEQTSQPRGVVSPAARAAGLSRLFLGESGNT